MYKNITYYPWYLNKMLFKFLILYILILLNPQQMSALGMNFNYHNYVSRMKYEPYQWPPDISLA